MAGRFVQLDGDCVPEGAAVDRGKLERAVVELVARLGMTELGVVGATVEEDVRKVGREPFEDEGGVSVVALLSTSHVAVHTWPLRRMVKVDVYSCREFNPELVAAWARDKLGTRRYTAETGRDKWPEA